MRPAGGFTDFLAPLEEFWGSEMAHIHGQPAHSGSGLLLAMPIWGRRYADRFAWYCLPSMLAPENLAVLRDACRIVIYTDKETFSYLWIALRGVERETGIEVILRLIPDAIMEGIYNQPKSDPVSNRYWTLGVAGQLGLQMAGRANMAFHMAMPDHCYAQAYFPSLLRLATQYEAIAQPGISASLPAAHDELYAFKQENGSLAIPDRALGTIGWRHLHPQTQANMISEKTFNDQFPLSHLWIWQGIDRLYISSCHMNAAYLSPRLCAMAPSRIPATIDAELPAFFPSQFHVPKADDGLCYIELSDATKPHDARTGNLNAFVSACCEKVRYSTDWMPYASQLCEVPIENQETFRNEATIRDEHAWLLAQLRDETPSLKAQAAYKLIESLAFKVMA